jgi:hypothetical protein
MKKLLTVISLLLVLSCAIHAEAIKLKNGMIINGSIVGQTEYVLSVQTSYGTISINQREVDTIMPDLNRVLLKGGGEFVGTVIDLDEFNLSLKTDSGVVNIDTSQIASMDIYDYDEAEKQQKYVEKKIELEQAAIATLPQDASSSEAAAAAASGSLSTSGLSFDSDLEKAFPSKPKIVEPEQKVIYKVHTFQGQEITEESAGEEEEIKPILDEEETAEQVKKKDSALNYFDVRAGVINSALKLNLTEDGGKADEKAGGAGAIFGVSYLRRLSSRLWLGAGFTLGLIPKHYVEISSEHELKTSGQILDLDVLLQFYINPKSKTRVYLLGGGGLNYMLLDKNSVKLDPKLGWGQDEAGSEKFSSTALGGVFGIGVERSIMDVNVGIEARGHYTSSYSEKLKDSDSLSCSGLLKVSWFF